MLTKLTWPSLDESLYNFCSTLVAFRSFILCFLYSYNKALCNNKLYLVKGGPASGSIILTSCRNIYNVRATCGLTIVLWLGCLKRQPLTHLLELVRRVAKVVTPPPPHTDQLYAE